MLLVTLWALAIMALLDVAIIWSALVVGKRSDRPEGLAVHSIRAHWPEADAVPPGPGAPDKRHRSTAV